MLQVQRLLLVKLLRFGVAVVSGGAVAAGGAVTAGEAVAAAAVATAAVIANTAVAAGTSVADVAAAVAASKGGAVEFRVEKAGIIHAGVGKASFDAKAIEENIRAFTSAVSKAKPSGSKGTYLKRVALSSTMGPGVRVDLASLSDA